MKLKYLAVGFLLASGLVATETTKTFTPTEVQNLRLQVKQRDAQIAQRDMVAAQEKFQNFLATLQSEGEKVRLENHWPDTVKFDPNTLGFTESTPTPVPATVPKPTPTKP
jgi:hypothetical protein